MIHRRGWDAHSAWWRLCLLAGVLFAIDGAPAQAQHPFAPGVAFGADVFPFVDGDRKAWALQFDLFSELSKDLVRPGDRMWPGSPELDEFQRYNDIEHTLGFNQIGHTWVTALQLAPGVWWHRTFWGSGGVVWDAPTEFIQNDFAHGIRLLTYVPRDGTVDHVVLGAGTDQSISWGTNPWPWLNVLILGGAGTGLSTSFVDGYGQLGLEVGFGGTQPWVQLGGLGRLAVAGDPLPWEGLNRGLSDGYRMWQAWGLLGFDRLMAWAPRLRVGFTHSRGPFASAAAAGGSRIVEKLWTIRLESVPGRWAVETWNDFVFKDLGPTFGLRIQWYR